MVQVQQEKKILKKKLKIIMILKKIVCNFIEEENCQVLFKKMN